MQHKVTMCNDKKKAYIEKQVYFVSSEGEKGYELWNAELLRRGKAIASIKATCHINSAIFKKWTK